MILISFIDHTGRKTEIEAAEEGSLMQAALNHGVKGILADCGGAAVCATCHVYVDDRHLAKLPEPSAAEDDMLDAVASERRPESRLSCQILLTSELEGLVVRLPESQA